MKRLIHHLPLIPRPTLLLPSLALKTVTSKSGKGVYASSDMLFKGAIFGRDSLEVADDLMSVRPRLVQRILLTLAGLQGLQSDLQTEEERGKIIHEYRTTIVDGKPLDPLSHHIFTELAKRWGGDLHTMAYYGSIDATPQFLRVIGHYCRQHGHQILQRTIKRRDGHIVPLHDTVSLAADWLIAKLATSTSGLLEYRTQNPHGIENQAWKDSREFYVHTNGKLANHKRPIASIEVQGLAYDALEEAALLLPERADMLRAAAQKLRDRTIKLLWMPREKYFALGIDYSAKNVLRRIETVTANPAELLDTCFFDFLPANQREQYVSAIVKRIMSGDFLTDAGIRSRGLSADALIKFWDYHGSFTSWPKETYDIAKGLRRQGLPKLAEQLENRILNVVHKSKNYPEFVYVDERGRVMTGPPNPRTHGELSLVIESTNRPESIQAWTVSAVLAIGASRQKRRHIHQVDWQIHLEQAVLEQIPLVQVLKGAKELTARYPDYPYRLAYVDKEVSGNFLHDDIARSHDTTSKTPGSALGE